ncbi:MAG: BrnT family toxin [Terriglobales bacterium]
MICFPELDADAWFDWDPGKSEQNKRRRGFDFEFAALVFFDPDLLFVEDRITEQGEERTLAIGRIGHFIYVVCFTERIYGDKNVTWIISARRAERHEEDSYYARL